ncbi:hypothetical protein JKO41_001589 [Neisseria gonorrhoeae]|uniref:Phage associated protein n=5 Tax=Neisseria gonorrhoeae TaxID=485 RepID=A0A1D3I0N4_NEIGO|nr:hypothetical protein [Neisseria gonorrhoeae]APW52928.1 hypothetical protein T556_03110 [Neisseria gonorrhoeae NG-k51.05]EEH61792.1 predicted protein [Neisseria gonorrhoeae 1291]EEZ43342.1 conserved hypothetical protein [Neisseria gonorrhoeae 35/02]EEZ47481.1 phage protein [Neisseria gonorrhoeae MS11]EEZ49840.1 predicted protein [Neisseria gonorrhoeae PID18]EFE04606.1 conserved hypothetical protein [Neisseria gonorrhoeae DGI2]KLR98366.1 hypothetical protein M683_10470 [Neisseria gonorrhoea
MKRRPGICLCGVAVFDNAVRTAAGGWMDKVFIKYIGGRAVWRDRIYHTGLVFEDGQVREVSAGAAAKLLRHGDVFAAVPGKRVEKADDTEALEKAGASELERETAAFDAVQDVILQINRMGKDELELYAKANYGQGLDKRKSAENLRGDVVRMVRQFGIAQ